ncbi:MAG: 50S ribosomal protein L6 [Patescibacteria group bacterium]|nr:50S ribosomal protein L6 [Patescibacteria group bacterium]
MSKIAKKPIILPAGVTVAVASGSITVNGPKGKLTGLLVPKVTVSVGEGRVSTSVEDPKDRRLRSLWGTMHSLLANMIEGVSSGYVKKLEIVGVGYRATADKTKLSMHLGYSHPVDLPIPAGLEVKVEKNLITVSGIDKQLVGQFSALVRQQRKPEPYKGKGIKYVDEVIRRKAGKVVKAVGG